MLLGGRKHNLRPAESHRYKDQLSFFDAEDHCRFGFYEPRIQDRTCSSFAGRGLPIVAELHEQTEYLVRVEIGQPEKPGVLLFSRGKNMALGKALA